MRSMPVRGGKQTMKLDPFYLLGVYGVTGVAVVDRNPAYAIDFMFALITGGLVALCFSRVKSRQRKADGIDTSLWAMIGLFGSTGLAFVLAPALDGRTVPLLGITLNQPLAAFLIAVGGTPFIEWMLTGEAFAMFRGWVEKRGKDA